MDRRRDMAEGNPVQLKKQAKMLEHLFHNNKTLLFTSLPTGTAMTPMLQ